MRDWLAVGSNARLRITAVEHGYRRELGYHDAHGDPKVLWRHEGGRGFHIVDAELLPQGIAERVRIQTCSAMSGECPWCGARLCAIEGPSEEDFRRMQLYRAYVVAGGVPIRDDGDVWIGIPHDANCVATPAAVAREAESRAN